MWKWTWTCQASTQPLLLNGKIANVHYRNYTLISSLSSWTNYRKILPSNIWLTSLLHGYLSWTELVWNKKEMSLEGKHIRDFRNIQVNQTDIQPKEQPRQVVILWEPSGSVPSLTNHSNTESHIHHSILYIQNIPYASLQNYNFPNKTMFLKFRWRKPETITV